MGNNMKIIIDVYYRNKNNGSYKIISEEITQEDIEQIAKDKTKDNLPMWMSDYYEYSTTNIDKVEL